MTYILENPGRYLYAVERRARMHEFAVKLAERARMDGVDIRIRQIHSRHSGLLQVDGTVRQEGSTNVRYDIERLPYEHPNPVEHVLVLITHEGLKMADTRTFEDWHLTIDETISIWDRQSINCTTDTTRAFFATNYELVPLTKSRRQIVAKTQRMGFVTDDTISGTLPALKVREVASDDMTRVASVLHSRVLSDRITVMTNLESWADLEGMTALDWSSLWCPQGLKAFARVHVLANGFGRSVTYQMMEKNWPELTWQSLNRPTPIRHRNRRVMIRYFAAAHLAQRTLWDTEVGKARLRKIALFLREHHGDDLIWMCTRADEATLRYPGRDEYIVPGVRLSPRQQGSNEWSHVSQVAMVYTVKPSPADRAALTEAGIDPQAYIDSHEREVMTQFACRSSVRVPESAAPVLINVYDHAQAAHLAEYFRATGYCEVHLELIDLGFAYDIKVPAKPGPKPKAPKILSDEDIAERRRQATERQRQCRARRKALQAPNDV
ncbi:hypothetical protein [Novosphingobium mangrovi (ex Hu et al. 2023)]|uniref:Uncharacterized protein n=1 Tax=Novosphingobium mangrovi (ex Hu et al. 2023) TaxID=2930094 RepID=A0ABT0AGX2_9SPHN|nr:hypothetical protein [Novosphingobium mangrovi (ex Hu et al. 2023)]MCJ1962444.1 hypothetical protein [Novosphingobium mangrovi (ex Hu et al. 2023)]